MTRSTAKPSLHERLADAGAPALMIVLAGIIPVILLSMAISRARAGGEIQ